MPSSAFAKQCNLKALGLSITTRDEIKGDQEPRRNTWKYKKIYSCASSRAQKASGDPQKRQTAYEEYKGEGNDVTPVHEIADGHLR